MMTIMKMEMMTTMMVMMMKMMCCLHACLLSDMLARPACADSPTTRPPGHLHHWQRRLNYRGGLSPSSVEGKLYFFGDSSVDRWCLSSAVPGWGWLLFHPPTGDLRCWRRGGNTGTGNLQLFYCLQQHSGGNDASQKKGFQYQIKMCAREGTKVPKGNQSTK